MSVRDKAAAEKGDQGRRWFRFIDVSVQGDGKEGVIRGVWDDSLSIKRIVGTPARMGDTVMIEWAHYMQPRESRAVWDFPPEHYGCIGECVTQWDDETRWRSSDGPTPPANILLEADTLIHGDRAKQYGSVHDNFGRWSRLCGEIGIEVSPQQLALIMVMGKLAREANAHKRDNIVDAAGYLGLYQELQ